MSDTKLAALSVDLDEITHYFAIHGLPADRETNSAVYDLALPRLFEFAESAQIPLTLFVVGRDLVRESSAVALQKFVRRGDELGNHSLDHLYDLTRQPEKERRHQVAKSSDLIERATGFLPRGFRAPGYILCDGLLDDLTDLDYRYDSSLFSSPTYYLLKAAAIGLGSIRGRRSASIIDTPRALFAPTRPYRTGRPYFRRGSGLIELPISVTRGLRLPYLGTTLALAGGTPLGNAPALALTAMMRGLPLINLEFHGIDFLDAEDGLSVLSRYQADLRVPWRRKVQTYHSVVESLRHRGYRWTTLLEASGFAA